MKSFAHLRALALAIVLTALVVATALPPSKVSAQSGRQPEKKKVEKKVDEQKGNPSAQPEPQEPVPPMPKSTKDDQVIKLSTQVVNVDVTVIDKKSGRIYSNLTQKNFTLYEDGVKQEIANFRNGEGQWKFPSPQPPVSSPQQGRSPDATQAGGAGGGDRDA